MPSRKKRIEIELTSQREAVEAAAELRTLRQSMTVTKERADALADALRDWIIQTGEDISAEGSPTLRVVPRRSYSFDVARMAEQDSALLMQLARTACLNVAKSQADALARRGLLHGYMEYAVVGESYHVRFDGNEDEE